MNSSTLTIQQFQSLIRDRYLAADSARGVAPTWMNFTEEVGELARALYKNDQPNIEEEMADLVAWLCTLANLKNVDLAAAVAKKYLGEGAPTGTK